MAPSNSIQLTALCAVASFLWLGHNIEGHQVVEQPRISALVLLLIGAVATFVTSFFAVLLPGANGRFDNDLGPLKTARNNLPRKPRRYFLPVLVVSIIIRLELLHSFSRNLPCSTPGIEALLPAVILLYEVLPGRRPWISSSADDKDEDGSDWSLYDRWVSWLTESRGSLTLGTILLAAGSYLASSNTIRSTVFCPAFGSRNTVVPSQWLGLFLDGAIAVLLWRVLAWGRTTRSRLKTLSAILLTSSLGTGLIYLLMAQAFKSPVPMSYHFKGLDSLYLFDIVVDGLTFSTFAICVCLLATERSPLSLIGVLTFLTTLPWAIQRAVVTGQWENTFFGITWLSLLLICVGFSFFIYANNLRAVLFIPRPFLVIILLIIGLSGATLSLVQGNMHARDHPLQNIIFSARLNSDKWFINAKTSNSLPVAVREYKERHMGRNPPPKFDVWFQYAAERKSAVIDHFAQIRRDTEAFWGISPQKIRADLDRIAGEPNIAILEIRDGEPSHNIDDFSPARYDMDALVLLVLPFSKHLPDMKIAVNTDHRPRVIAPWDDVKRFALSGRQHGIGKLLHRRIEGVEERDLSETPLQPAKLAQDSIQRNFTSVRALREMTALTCAAGTRTRSGVHWDIRDFCVSCAKPQSSEQFLTEWEASQALCHQSDLLRLHSFHTIPPEHRPLQELVPVFSRAKTDSYSDILIPLGTSFAAPDKDDSLGFEMKQKKLFWRGTAPKMASIDHIARAPEVLRGGHQQRLVHLVNNATSSDRITAMVPPPGEKRVYWYETAPAPEINAVLPMDVGFSSYGPACDDNTNKHKDAKSAYQRAVCNAMRDEFGLKIDDETKRDHGQYQYTLVMDAEDGPPPEPTLLNALRSNSVPLYASIFRSWYSERLFPWVHFVPIDLRFHALHSTLAYFTGIRGKDNSVNGRTLSMKAKTNDAKWIAEQGRYWAKKALRKEDAEIYLFRLLLEWGRLLDDRRDEIGYVTPE